MSQPRILLVDDESSILLTLAANLELAGFTVVEADSAGRALELAARERFDLVLSDIRMPGMSGVELFKRLKTLCPGVPVILMTAFAFEEHVREAMRLGVFTVLSKPFDVEKLVALLVRASRHPLVLVVEAGGTTGEELAAAGVRAETVPDIDAAVAFLSQRAVDVCVAEVESARPNPGPPMERILAADRSVAMIVIANGSLRPAAMSRLADLGVQLFLIRPVSTGQLVEGVARLRALGVR